MICKCGHPSRVHQNDRCDGTYSGRQHFLPSGACDCKTFAPSLDQPNGHTECDLSNDVSIRWIFNRDQTAIVAASVCHKTTQGECCGYIALRGHPNPEGVDTWEFDGNYELPTLSPSVLCKCGFHGFIRGGIWESADSGKEKGE